MNERDDAFGPIQAAGCYGMMACAAVALLVVVAAGAYTLSTGEALQLPIVEIGVVWVAVLAVFELMAFGWLMLRTVLLAIVIAVPFVLVFHAVEANAATIATAERTDDPTELALTVKLDMTVRRPLDRKVFVDACGLPILACDGQLVSKRVHLRKGRNRKTVKLAVRRMVYQFVGVQVTGIPWDGYRMVAAPVDTVWFWFGHGEAQEVWP